MTARRRAFVEATAKVVPEVLDQAGFKKDFGLCILGTATVVETLRRLGVSARPLVAEAYILNAQAAERLKRGESLEQIYAAMEVDGSWTVGLGLDDRAVEPGRWPGHLVATTTNPDMLVDVSLDQASRPQRGIHLETGAWPLEERAQAQGRGPVLLGGDNGELVLYRPRRTDTSYRSSPDWRHVERRRVIADRAVPLVRQHAECITKSLP